MRSFIIIALGYGIFSPIIFSFLTLKILKKFSIKIYFPFKFF